MGNNLAEDQEPIEETEVLKTEETEETSIDSEENTETEEVEIVRETEGSQPISDNQTGIRKRINKLNTKVAVANEKTSDANAELAIEKQRSQILEIALEQERQKSPAIVTPNPEDFNNGISDPEYIKKQGEYTQSIIQQQVAAQVAEATRQNHATTDSNIHTQALQRKQVTHYERVHKMGIKNYSDIEDKAIDILGNETVIQIIDNFDDAHILLAYLGTEKNLSEAESLANLIKSNPVQGVAEIGRLRSELKIKPKSTNAPDPDTEIKGDKPNDGGQLSKKLNKLREAAANGGDMAELMKFKKENPGVG